MIMSQTCLDLSRKNGVHGKCGVTVRVVSVEKDLTCELQFVKIAMTLAVPSAADIWGRIVSIWLLKGTQGKEEVVALDSMRETMEEVKYVEVWDAM